MKYLEQTRETYCFNYYKEKNQQIFTVLIFFCLLASLAFETWVLCFVDTIDFLFIPEISIFMTHLMVILCIVYFVFGLFVLNQYNQVEMRQRIDKFGVETKLEVMFTLVTIDLIFCTFTSLSSVLCLFLKRMKTAYLYNNIAFLGSTSILACLKSFLLYITYRLHPDIFMRDFTKKVNRYRLQRCP